MKLADMITDGPMELGREDQSCVSFKPYMLRKGDANDS